MTKRKSVAHILSIAPAAALLAMCATVQDEVAATPTPVPDEPKRNRHGLTWIDWCARGDIDPTQFGSRNLPGRWLTLWLQGVNPITLLTMKDRNGHNIRVGDRVALCGENGDLADIEGQVSDIIPNQICAWDGKLKTIAVITIVGADRPWQRYGNNVVRIDT